MFKSLARAASGTLLAILLFMALLLQPTAAVRAQVGGCSACDSYSGLTLCVRDDSSPWAHCRTIEVCYFGGLFCVDRCVFSSYCDWPT